MIEEVEPQGFFCNVCGKSWTFTDHDGDEDDDRI
jgi:hypothetical protein